MKVLEHSGRKEEKSVFIPPRPERPGLVFQVCFSAQLVKNCLKQRARAQAREQEDAVKPSPATNPDGCWKPSHTTQVNRSQIGRAHV